MKEGLLNLWIYKKKTNSDNFIYKYETEKISPKDFSNYQNLKELFKGLRDGNIEVSKYQIKFKYVLGEIKKGNPKSKLKYQISVI